MDNYPASWQIKELIDTEIVQYDHSTSRWIPGRKMGYPSLFSRARLAWAVFVGKADALFWEVDLNG